MKNIQELINEKLKISSKSRIYNYYPKSTDELRDIIDEKFGKYGCGTKQNPIDMNDIDVSHIRDFEAIFDNCYQHYFDVSDWDMSNAETIEGMFYNCRLFNVNLEKWNTSKITNICAAFEGCESFEGVGLEKWNISNVYRAYRAFIRCKNLNPIYLEDWKILLNQEIYLKYDRNNHMFDSKHAPLWWPKEYMIY